VLAQKQTSRSILRIKDPEANPHSESHLIFAKVPKTHVRQSLQKMVLGKLVED
jgi:hypothetical protein